MNAFYCPYCHHKCEFTTELVEFQHALCLKCGRKHVLYKGKLLPLLLELPRTHDLHRGSCPYCGSHYEFEDNINAVINCPECEKDFFVESVKKDVSPLKPLPAPAPLPQIAPQPQPQAPTQPQPQAPAQPQPQAPAQPQPQAPAPQALAPTQVLPQTQELIQPQIPAQPQIPEEKKTTPPENQSSLLQFPRREELPPLSGMEFSKALQIGLPREKKGLDKVLSQIAEKLCFR